MTGLAAIASSYNGLLITAERAAAVFQEARQGGLLRCTTPTAMPPPRFWLFCAPIWMRTRLTLKPCRRRIIANWAGVLQHVLDTVQAAHDLGLRVEAVTPGRSPGSTILRVPVGGRALSGKGVSPNIPWHVTGFHPDYKMTRRPGDQRCCAAACRRYWPGGRLALCARRQPAGPGRLAGRHGVPALPGPVWCAAAATPCWNRLTRAHTCPRCAAPTPGVAERTCSRRELV